MRELTLAQARQKQQQISFYNRVENRCNGAVVDGTCQKCGRFLRRWGVHLPNRDGSCGYRYYWRDGDTYLSSGFDDNL